jgi:hypothetical protein
MDFLLYLTPVGNEIINKIISKKYIIKENAPICRKHRIYGFLKSPEFIICTDNIKNGASPSSHYINETVYHEAVHIAQICKKGPIGISTVGLDEWKLKDASRSSSITGQNKVYELEAYYLEDKPDLINQYLEKFCF